MRLNSHSPVPEGEHRQSHWNSAQKTQEQTACRRPEHKAQDTTEPTRTQLTSKQPAGNSTQADSQEHLTAGEESGSPNRKVAGA